MRKGRIGAAISLKVRTLRPRGGGGLLAGGMAWREAERCKVRGSQGSPRRRRHRRQVPEQARAPARPPLFAAWPRKQTREGVARPKPHLQPVLPGTNTPHRAAGPPVGTPL